MLETSLLGKLAEYLLKQAREKKAELRLSFDEFYGREMLRVEFEAKKGMTFGGKIDVERLNSGEIGLGEAQEFFDLGKAQEFFDFSNPRVPKVQEV